ncbi:MAG: UDP-N-acetylglucosamine--N-acetylmuramyl-(pentapeptide) pyrophosphoryl-undecaprenol N-acetylglucosamine transferase [Patescibacteria group bacterium]|jgi:UDP-N-acetylglucosamine--N-acetylmuramyl-(pentapeptide) pyrophosphoryl-undecaprenol N-acetylglucosamine transferase
MKTYLFTGGGTLGPVTPLLASAELLREREPDAKIVWIGTPNGPEKSLVESAHFEFISLSAPKFDRTRLWTMPFVLPKFLLSCIRANAILQDLEPQAIVSAGAYVSVPMVVVAKTLGIPVIIEQLDVTPGIANRIMTPFASKILVTWEENMKSFPKKKTALIGGTVRRMITLGQASMARERYGLRADAPTILVLGGGTGAAMLNELMLTIGPELAKEANVIHLTGKGKLMMGLSAIGHGYVPLEFLGEGMADAYALADLVVARAGMGTIMELVALRKPTILVPLPYSHQEANAYAVQARGGAIVLGAGSTPQNLLQTIRKLLKDEPARQTLAQNMGKLFPLGGEEKLVEAIQAIVLP